jgi:hypothetical protein
VRERSPLLYLARTERKINLVTTVARDVLHTSKGQKGIRSGLGYKRLPSTPTKEDLEAVAAKLLAMRWNSRTHEWNASSPRPHRDFIKMIVGYALTCKMRLPAVAATVEEARYQARKQGRSYIVATDIRAALLDYQIPSDEALQQAFQPSERRPPKQAHINPDSMVTSDLQRRCNGVASPRSNRY